MKHMGHTMASRAGTTGKQSGKSAASSPSGRSTRTPRAPAAVAKPTAKATAKPTAKPAARAAAKPAAKPAGPSTTGPERQRTAAVRAPVEADPPLRKRELVDAVAERSGVRKKHAKVAIEAMLDILGAALAEGREINLQPFGKINRKRVRDTDGALVVTARIRQSKPTSSPSGEQPARGEGTAASAPAENATQTVADAAE